MRFALVCAAALFVFPAHAVDVLTLVGKLGSRDIVVELTPPEAGAVAGRYTFMDTGGDIPLVAVSHDAKGWVLHEEAECGEADCTLDDAGKVVEAPTAAVWTLSYDPDAYVAAGTRAVTTGKAKSQKLELMVMAWRELGPSEETTAFGLHDRSAQFSYMHDWPLDWSGAPYEMTLLDVPLEEGPAEALGDATFRMVTDPRTKVAFPRAVALPDGSPVDPANAILADRHYRMNLAAMDCLALRFASYGIDSEWGMRGGFLADYDNETVTLSYLSPRLVSWTQSGSLWCTGAHPYNHFDSDTYDLKTGKPLDLRTLFSAWVPREYGATPDQIADTDLAQENPDAYQWGPDLDLIAFVRQRMTSDILMGDAEFDEACYGEQAIAEHLDIRFAPGPSAVLTVSGYPHVMSACTTDLFTVPLAEMAQFLTPEARDYFPEIDR
ncbi:hypothetical protein NIM87_16430 [Devosia sp. XJ19-1]|uniref:DUF4424 domain-containing protein n=1 Tax=Devosia ureilytica TaxID=2952754 RepID=A0A9Q4FUU7_9HYPH|nr:hypothetical protein [Devosia ureilytica]MCP8885097.1 hypothetical protein [Devosia ureilytica]MCP8888819.1 hypothetical protein [Devosia ureilytica]